MKQTRGRNLVSMILNETQDRDSSVSPLPPGAESLRDEIEFLEKIDLDSIESEPFSETVLFSNPSLQQSRHSPNSVEYQIISVVADVHEIKSNKSNTRQVLDTAPKKCLQKENSQEFEDIISVVSTTPYCDDSLPLPIDYINSPLSDLSMTQESIECMTPMPSNLRDFSPEGTDTGLDFGSDNSPYPGDNTDSPFSTPGNRKRKSQKKKDLGNLRETYQDMWIDEKRKYNVNRGLKYTSRNGKIKLEKQIKPPCPPTCKKKCTVHLTESDREKIFNIFWTIGNHTRQWDFIAKYVKREKVNRTTKSDSTRTCTVKYFFPKKNDITGDITAIPVCKVMFLNTLAISYNFMKTALDKFNQGNGSIEPDRRGKHNNHPKSIEPDVIKSVCDHVNSLAPVESHLVRKRSDKLYLEGSLTFSKMFSLYTEWFDYSKYEEKALNVRQYRDIVNKNFKLSFHIPKKDKCDTCHIYENLDKPSVKEQSEHALHLEEKNRARDLKQSDKETATQNKEILTVVFDLQKTLSTPHGNISVFYYKRKLNVFNFSTFDMGSLQGRCYCWHEQIAKRGANEIASNVLHFIQSKIPDNVKEFRFWSDNCGGQNRNRIVFLMYMYACWKYNISIIHRFMVVGHTQNEGDSMHALIERRTKNVNIYTSEQWYMAMRMAKTEKPYEVIEVSQDSIFDFKACLKLFNNWKKGTNKQIVMWSQMCEIFVSHEEPFTIKYKYTFEQEYESIECASIKQTRSRLSELEVGLNNITVAYQAPLPIDKQKLKDLNDLCKTGTIPAKYHEFYHKLV